MRWGPLRKREMGPSPQAGDGALSASGRWGSLPQAGEGATNLVTRLVCGDRLPNFGRDDETWPEAIRQLRRALAERLDPRAVDELHRTAGPAGKTDAKDRADVRIVH